jgi:hypothetical protein
LAVPRGKGKTELRREGEAFHVSRVNADPAECRDRHVRVGAPSRRAELVREGDLDSVRVLEEEASQESRPSSVVAVHTQSTRARMGIASSSRSFRRKIRVATSGFPFAFAVALRCEWWGGGRGDTGVNLQPYRHHDHRLLAEEFVVGHCSGVNGTGNRGVKSNLVTNWNKRAYAA